jgi:F0F1-type ATP synthase assembly protein I
MSTDGTPDSGQPPAGSPAAPGDRPPRAGARQHDGTAEAMRSFGTLGSVGLSFVISIVLGAGAGLLIDRWIGAGHWGFFLGFFLGLAAGVVTVVRASKSIR